MRPERNTIKYHVKLKKGQKMAHNKNITKKAKLLRKTIKGLSFIDSIKITKMLNGKGDFDINTINNILKPLGIVYFTDNWDFVPLNTTK